MWEEAGNPLGDAAARARTCFSRTGCGLLAKDLFTLEVQQLNVNHAAGEGS